jgi:multiple sugar transport system permease protein
MAGSTGWNKWKWVIFFLAPGLLGMLVFIIYPILSSFWLAFNDWNLLKPPQFVGLANFQELFADKDFWRAVHYTLTFIVMYVPAVFVLGLALALFLNQKLKGIVIVRTATFLPVVASWVVVSIIWKWIFNPQYGLVNYPLSLIGIDGPNWLFQPQSALVALVITSVWKDVGYIALLYLGKPIMKRRRSTVQTAGSGSVMSRSHCSRQPCFSLPLRCSSIISRCSNRSG